MCLDLGRALSRASRRSPNFGSNHSQPLQWSTVAGIVGEKMKDAQAVLTATRLYKRGTKTAPGVFLRRSPQAKPQMQKGNSAKRGIEQRTQMFTVRWLGWNVCPPRIWHDLAWITLACGPKVKPWLRPLQKSMKCSGVRYSQITKLLFGQLMWDLRVWCTAGGMDDV